MGKIRAKDVKPKLQPDFNKKKAKVGRKIKPANITKIKVQTKRIHIPLQAHITGEKLENEKDLVDKALKLLQHHSTPSRIAALDDLKGLLAASPNAESYVSLVFPPALELLFDEERDVRDCLQAFLLSLLNRFPSSSFIAIVPVMITYICSGLTNLHKGVRRDALGLLLSIARTHPRTLLPHLEKLVEHVLALLFDSSQLGGSDSLAVATTSNGSAGGGVISKAKSDKKLWKAAENASVTNSTVGGREEKTKPSGPTRPPLLLAVLEVLHALLASASDGRKAENSDDTVVNQTGGSAGPYQAIILRPVRRTCLYLQGKGQPTSVAPSSSSSSAGSAVADIRSDRLLSSERLIAIINCLRNIWRGLVLDNSILPVATINLITLVARVACIIGDVFDGIQYDEFKYLIDTMFANFPHTATESGVAAPGSNEEKTAKNAATSLDMELSNLSLLYFANPRYTIPEKHSDVCDFVMRILNGYVDDLEGEAAVASSDAIDAAIVATAATTTVEEEDSASKMQVDDEVSGGVNDDHDHAHHDNESIFSSATHRDRISKSYTRMNADLSKQVFSALETMISSDGRRKRADDHRVDMLLDDNTSGATKESSSSSSVRRAAAGAGAGAQSETTTVVSDDQWSMKNLLLLVKRLMVAFTSCAAPVIARGARVFITSLLPALHCLFRIAADDFLWSSEGSSEGSSASFILLAESMGSVAPLMATLFAATGQWHGQGHGHGHGKGHAVTVVSHFTEETQQLADSYARSLLSILRRINAMSSSNSIDKEEEEGEEEQGEGVAGSQVVVGELSNSVLKFFEKLSDVSLGTFTVEQQKYQRKGSLYVSCAPFTRYTVLDILGHASFPDTLSAAIIALKTLSSASVDVSEQQYILRVLHDRRAEMGVADYTDALFSFLRANITSRSNLLGVSDTSASSAKTALKAVIDASSSRWLADDVADSIIWCSSADAPEKIVAFVEARVRGIMSPLSKELSNTISGGFNQGSSTDNEKQKNKFKSPLTNFASGSAALSICFRLLAPLLHTDTDPTAPPSSAAAVKSARDTIISILTDVCVAQIVLYANTLKETLTASDADYARLFAHTVRALSLRIVTATSSNASTGDHNYPVLRSVVSQLSKLWPKLSKELKTNSLGGLGSFFLHHEAIAMVTECREYVNSSIADLKKSV